LNDYSKEEKEADLDANLGLDFSLAKPFTVLSRPFIRQIRRVELRLVVLGFHNNSLSARNSSISSCLHSILELEGVLVK
jgi:hypothetical protein